MRALAALIAKKSRKSLEASRPVGRCDRRRTVNWFVRIHSLVAHCATSQSVPLPDDAEKATGSELHDDWSPKSLDRGTIKG